MTWAATAGRSVWRSVFAGGESPLLRMGDEGQHGEDAAVAVAGVGDVQLLEDAAHVGLHGAFGEGQPRGYGCIGMALRDQCEDVVLAFGEHAERAVSAGR